MVYGSGLDCGAYGGGARTDRDSVDGGRRAADAALDAGVRGDTPAATAAPTPAAAPAREIVPEPPDTSFERASDVGGVPGGVVGGVIGGIPEAPPPPPPPAAPVRVGGNIKPPMKTKDIRPVYPPIAQSARVQGVVIIEATIGPNGRVQDARVLRSIPLLDAAALDAVRQWEFTPTLLNGVPVPVIMTVTVQFTLS